MKQKHLQIKSRKFFPPKQEKLQGYQNMIRKKGKETWKIQKSKILSTEVSESGKQKSWFKKKKIKEIRQFHRAERQQSFSGAILSKDLSATIETVLLWYSSTRQRLASGHGATEMSLVGLRNSILNLTSFPIISNLPGIPFRFYLQSKFCIYLLLIIFTVHHDPGAGHHYLMPR